MDALDTDSPSSAFAQPRNYCFVTVAVSEVSICVHDIGNVKGVETSITSHAPFA
jgi:hypothetical protein